jgi:gamma-glutamyl-gamma-aminobutyrate hydrolase PuuD
MTTLATVPMGTGIADEIAALFTKIERWSPNLEYDAIVIEGGADIHPSLYNNPNTDSHVADTPSRRDIIEREAINDAISKGALIIGICRGAQLACALAGGRLVQHVNNHGGSHPVVTNDGKIFNVSSVHHQQMYPWDVEHDMLAWSTDKFSDCYRGYGINMDKHQVEPEAVYFPKIKALAFQWHPEWYASKGEIDFTISKIKEKLHDK